MIKLQLPSGFGISRAIMVVMALSAGGGFTSSLSAEAATPTGCTNDACRSMCRALYVVNSAVDNNAGGAYCYTGKSCTLRQAIVSANTCSSIIGNIEIQVPSGVHAIASANSSEHYTDKWPSSGDLDVMVPAFPLLITGTGDATVISGGGRSRVFDIHSSAYVTLQNLRITQGLYSPGMTSAGYAGPDGGAGVQIRAGGVAILRNVTMDSNHLLASAIYSPDTSCGGALANAGAVYLDNVRFNHNTSNLAGGAICNKGVLNANNVGFHSNRTTLIGPAQGAGGLKLGGGGAIYSAPGIGITLRNSMFNNNSSYRGGAIYLDGVPGGTMSMSQVSSTLFSYNSAQNSGGAIGGDKVALAAITDSEFTRNSAKAAGGAVYLSALTGASAHLVSRSVFRYNESGNGGAVFADYGTTNVNNSLFQYNSARQLGVPGYPGRGAALSNLGVLVLRDSALSQNWADEQAGGIYGYGPIKLYNTTVHENTASYQASAAVALQRLEMKNTTFLRNSGKVPGAVAQIFIAVGSKLVTSYSILQNNLDNSKVSALIHGSVLTRGYNAWNGSGLEGFLMHPKDRGGVDSQLSLTAEKVGPQIGFGGTSQNLVFRPLQYGASHDTGESYVNASDDVMLDGCLRTDAAGIARPVLGYCDIGAIERGYTAPAIVTGTVGTNPGTFSTSTGVKPSPVVAPTAPSKSNTMVMTRF